MLVISAVFQRQASCRQPASDRPHARESRLRPTLRQLRGKSSAPGLSVISIPADDWPRPTQKPQWWWRHWLTSDLKDFAVAPRAPVNALVLPGRPYTLTCTASCVWDHYTVSVTLARSDFDACSLLLLSLHTFWFGTTNLTPECCDEHVTSVCLSVHAQSDILDWGL